MAAAGGGSRPRTGEDGFLARSGVTSYVRDVLTLVLETRPADPIAFIAEYLGNGTRKKEKEVKGNKGKTKDQKS